MDLTEMKSGRGGEVDWSCLAQDMIQWRDLVNIRMSLQIPQNDGNFLSG
jgi:hypothetical protein